MGHVIIQNGCVSVIAGWATIFGFSPRIDVYMMMVRHRVRPLLLTATQNYAGGLLPVRMQGGRADSDACAVGQTRGF